MVCSYNVRSEGWNDASTT